MNIYNEKYFTNHIEKVKQVEYEKEIEGVSHSRVWTDNESEMSTFLVVYLVQKS